MLKSNFYLCAFFQMIIKGGENLFPKEIEDFLNTHENILEAHVVIKYFNYFKCFINIILYFLQIGIPDERMGEEVGAFISLKDKTKTLTREDVKTFCKNNLAHFKIPKFIIVVDEFPKTSSGKIQKYKFLKVFDDKIEKLK